MQIKIVSTGRLIEPFEDPPGSSLLLNRPLSEWQAEAYETLGLTVSDSPTGPHLEVTDALWAPADTLGRFIEEAGGKNGVFVLADSIFGRHSTPVQPGVTKVDGGWRFETVRFVSGGDEPFEDIVIDPDEQELSVPVPEYYLGTDKLEGTLVRYPIMTIHHWVHILWANRFAQGFMVRSAPKWRAIWGGLRVFLTTWSFNKWKLLGKLNQTGSGCDIHPTAVVEGCTLGKNVMVGPYARLRFAHIGDGCNIMGGAQVELSVLGDGVWVGANCQVNYCVLYPGAIANMPIVQASLFGERVVTTGATWFMDLNFDQHIRVPLDGELHTTGQFLLGSAIGHEAKIGAGLFLASGRMIPKGTFVIRDPDTNIRKAPLTLAGQGPLVVGERGALRPYGVKALPKPEDSEN